MPCGECDGVIRLGLLPAGWCHAQQNEIPSMSGYQTGLTTNHDKHLTHANDQLPLVFKDQSFQEHQGK